LNEIKSISKNIFLNSSVGENKKIEKIVPSTGIAMVNLDSFASN